MRMLCNIDKNVVDFFFVWSYVEQVLFDTYVRNLFVFVWLLGRPFHGHNSKILRSFLVQIYKQ